MKKMKRFTSQYTKYSSSCSCIITNACRCKRRRSAAKRRLCKVCFKSFTTNKDTYICSDVCESKVARFKCPTCHKEVVRPKVYGTAGYCSIGCKEKGKPTRSIDKLEVYSLFDFKCFLCSKEIDMNARVGKPMSPTLDHVLPRSHGGSSDWFNLAPAHAICNHKKSDMIDYGLIAQLQERLYGEQMVVFL